MRVQFKPLRDMVLVLPDPMVEVTAGGILIPDTAQKKPPRGVVKAVGPGRKDKPMVLKEGNRVQYGKWSGNSIELDEGVFMLMHEDEVVGIL